MRIKRCRLWQMVTGMPLPAGSRKLLKKHRIRIAVLRHMLCGMSLFCQTASLLPVIMPVLNVFWAPNRNMKRLPVNGTMQGHGGLTCWPRNYGRDIPYPVRREISIVPRIREEQGLRATQPNLIKQESWNKKLLAMKRSGQIPIMVSRQEKCRICFGRHKQDKIEKKKL